MSELPFNYIVSLSPIHVGRILFHGGTQLHEICQLIIQQIAHLFVQCTPGSLDKTCGHKAYYVWAFELHGDLQKFTFLKG